MVREWGQKDMHKGSETVIWRLKGNTISGTESETITLLNIQLEKLPKEDALTLKHDRVGKLFSIFLSYEPKIKSDLTRLILLLLKHLLLFLLFRHAGTSPEFHG